MLNPTLLSGKNREQAEVAVTQLGFTPKIKPKERDHGFRESMQAAFKKRESAKPPRQAKAAAQPVKRDLQHKDPFVANPSAKPDSTEATRQKRANPAASHHSTQSERAQAAAGDATEKNARAAAKHHAAKQVGNEPHQMDSSCKPDSAHSANGAAQGSESRHEIRSKAAQEPNSDAKDATEAKGQSAKALGSQPQESQPQDSELPAIESEWALTQAMALMPDSLQNQGEILIQNFSLPASAQAPLATAVEGEAALEAIEENPDLSGNTGESSASLAPESDDADWIAEMATGNASQKQTSGDKTNQALNAALPGERNNLNAEADSVLRSPLANQGPAPVSVEGKAQSPGELKAAPSDRSLQGLTPAFPNLRTENVATPGLEVPTTDSPANTNLANPAAPGLATVKATFATAAIPDQLNPATPSSLPKAHVEVLPQIPVEAKTFSNHPEALRLIDGEDEDETEVRFEGEFIGLETDAESHPEENLGRTMANGKGEGYASLNLGSHQPGGQGMQDGQMHQQGQQGPWASSALTQAKWQGAGSESGSANFDNFGDSAGSSASTAQARLQDIQAMLKRELDAKATSLWQVGSETIEMQLTPEHLGKVKVALELKEGSVTAHIQVQSEAARQAVDQGMQQLRDNLGLHGFRIENLSVSVEDRHAGLFNPDGRSSNPFHRPNKGGDGNSLDDEQGEAAPAMRYLGYNTLEITA